MRLFGAGDLPQSILPCLLCGAPEADLQHLLLRCTGTRDLYVSWLATRQMGSSLPAAEDTQMPDMLSLLFEDRLDGHDLVRTGARINHVGRVCYSVASAFRADTNWQQPIDEIVSDAMALAKEF